jgi:phenylacetate-CoA ligase
MGTEGQLRFLKKVNPEILIGMPTFAYHVLQEAVDQKLRCPNLRLIVLGGEKVPDGMRAKLIALARRLDAMDCGVVSTYGFTEAKMAFAECPTPPGEITSGFHTFPDQALFEIVDPATGIPVPPGEPGEIVYTPLDARGTVVLRYRTGDCISGGLVHEECPWCGRLLPRLVGRISRSSAVQEMNLGKLKGTLVDFNELEHILDDAAPVGAWQLELRKRNDDPLEIDELILHVHKLGAMSDETLSEEVNRHFAAHTEVQPNRIVFHTAAEMRRLQGVGAEMKEKKVVDHRPLATSAGPLPISRSPRHQLEPAHAINTGRKS